jgi:chorismate mutase
MSVVSDTPDLDVLRERIDAIDTQLLELIAERIRIVLEVGSYKRERGIEVYDPARERALLERLSDAPPAPLDAATVRRIFERLVDESRRLEQRHVTREP